MDSLVSVIIPCCNAQQTIERAVESVLNQTYRNTEIIVINDGSDDESGKIVQRLMARHENIILISTGNMGVSSARNRGISESKGKYIVFLDADDIYAPNFIEMLAYGMEHYECDTAYCRWVRGDFEENSIFSEESPSVFLRKQMLKRKNRISFFNYMYRRDTLMQYDIFFPADLKYGEDTLFAMNYLSHCGNAVSVSAGLYRYCDNEGSAMHNAVWRMTDVLEAVRRIEGLLVDTPIYDDYRSFAFPRAVWANAKDFAKAGNHQLFLKLDREYNVKIYMKQLLGQPDVEAAVKISAVIYILNKEIFYWLISRMPD